MSNLNLIMPMGGAGSRFFKSGFVIPKPLIEIHNKPFFYWATESITKYIDVQTLTFVILQQHIDEFNIQNKILEFYPNAKFVILPQILNGALLTSLEGIKEIDNTSSILFNDCDHMFCCSEFNDLINKDKLQNIDGALLTFKSNEDKFSYVGLDSNGFVEKTVEKQVISNNAICGAYYFKNKDILITSTEEYLQNCNYSEYYISGIYNIMANNGKKIKNYNVDFHVSFGTPDEYIEADKLDIWEMV